MCSDTIQDNVGEIIEKVNNLITTEVEYAKLILNFQKLFSW